MALTPNPNVEPVAKDGTARIVYHLLFGAGLLLWLLDTLLHRFTRAP